MARNKCLHFPFVKVVLYNSDSGSGGFYDWDVCVPNLGIPWQQGNG